LLVISDNVN